LELLKTIKFIGVTVVALLITPSTFAETPKIMWYEKISAQGDIRLRWEDIYKNPGNDTERERFRARLGMSTNIVDDIKLILRFESGIDDPVSSNQTFGSGDYIKDFGIGRAYVDWKVNEKLKIMAGKMKIPWYTASENSLLWDNDLNPEGIFGSYKANNIFLNGGYFIINQDSGISDTILYSSQIGRQLNVNNTSSLTLGIGYYDYKNALGSTPFYKAKGNTIDAQNKYTFNYKLYELFSEFKTEISNLPVSFHAEIIKNSAITNNNKAYSVGVKIGSIKNHGDKQFSYAYHDTDKDALIGSYSDSDFAGGNTDSRGHFIRAKYGLKENMALGGVFIVSKYNTSPTDEIKYNRIQIDLEFQF